MTPSDEEIDRLIQTRLRWGEEDDIIDMLLALKARAEAAEKRAEKLTAGLQVLSTTFYKGDQHQDYAKHVLAAPSDFMSVPAADVVLALKARAEAAEQACQDHMNAIAYTTAQLGTVARRAEAAEKRALELALALDAALTGWHDAPPAYQDDYDSIAELRAVLEAKP